VVDPSTGLTKYRVATEPRDTAPLGSCTASSPCEEALAAAQSVLDTWRTAEDPEASAEALATQQRARLAHLFELPSDVAIALTPSGTDAVYVVSSLMLRNHQRVHHVVVGASELGGGTLHAARGLAIGDAAPFGSATKGDPVEGLSAQCTAEPVYLRDDGGVLLEPGEVDRLVEGRLAQVPHDAGIVLHLVAHSKTGLRAPSTDLCESLRARYGDRLLVLVDAAQGRVAPRDIRSALELGFAVLFTGSKFYSGPPFSSALLVPRPWSRGPGPLAAGLSDWFARADFPPHWEVARHSLREPYNAGMIMRWEAALFEIEGYHAIQPRHRAGVYHTFAGAVHEVLGPGDVIELDVPTPPVHQLATALGAFPSVFSFRVHGPDGPLDAPALKVLHRQLDSDLTAEHPELPGRFHLGQPVPLGPPDSPERQAVLRVALGARLVRQLAHSDDMGAGYFRETLRGVRRKIEGLVGQAS